MSPIYRFNDWLASRFAGVQYPKQTLLPKQGPPPFFKHQMPAATRVILLIFAAIAIPIGLLGLLGIGLILFFVLKAIIQA